MVRKIILMMTLLIIPSMQANAVDAISTEASGLTAVMEQAEARLSDLIETDESGSFIVSQQAAALEAAALLDEVVDESVLSRLAQMPLPELESISEFVQYAALWVINGGPSNAIEQSVMNRLESVLKELSERRPLTAQEIRRIYTMRIRMNDYSSARSWFESHSLSGLERLPNELDAARVADGTPNYWIYDDTAKQWQMKSMDTSMRGHIVVIASPFCEFVRELTQNIESDPELTELLRGRTLFLASPYQDYSFYALEQWAATHPDLPMGLMIRRTNWPFIDEIRVTPWIYWVENGEASAFEEFDETLRALLHSKGPKDKVAPDNEDSAGDGR